MDPLTLITDIQPLAPARFGGEQPQRAPFFQGQLLQGLVTAKGEGQQFTLEINGRPVSAESAAPLQIGQRLDLHVAALAPRMELQIVAANPVNRWLGSALPLLGQHTTLLPAVATLAEDKSLLSGMSPAARATLQLYAGFLPQMEGGPTAPSPASVHLINLIGQTVTTPGDRQLQALAFKIGGLLEQIASTPLLSAQTAAAASRLAEHFNQAALRGDFSAMNADPRSPVLQTNTQTPGAASPSPQPGTLATIPPTLLLLPNLPAVLKAIETLPDTHPLRQVLTLVTQVEGERSTAAGPHAGGTLLHDRVHGLGLNMERLLAGDSPEEAIRTLKFALLEVAGRAEAASDRNLSPERMVQTLELYQLLQLRLAGEALIFLPLPFPFLQQGFLLIDRDRAGKDQDDAGQQTDRPNQSASLHLQLEGLGNLQIDIHRQEDRIALTFRAEQPEQARFLAKFRDELEQWITGGRLESVQFLLGAKEPNRTLLETIVGQGGTGMIDTTA